MDLCPSTCASGGFCVFVDEVEVNQSSGNTERRKRSDHRDSKNLRAASKMHVLLLVNLQHKTWHQLPLVPGVLGQTARKLASRLCPGPVTPVTPRVCWQTRRTNNRRSFPERDTGRKHKIEFHPRTPINHNVLFTSATASSSPPSGFCTKHAPDRCHC